MLQICLAHLRHAVQGRLCCGGLCVCCRSDLGYTDVGFHFDSELSVLFQQFWRFFGDFTGRIYFFFFSLGWSALSWLLKKDLENATLFHYLIIIIIILIILLRGMVVPEFIPGKVGGVLWEYHGFRGVEMWRLVYSNWHCEKKTMCQLQNINIIKPLNSDLEQQQQNTYTDIFSLGC